MTSLPVPVPTDASMENFGVPIEIIESTGVAWTDGVSALFGAGGTGCARLLGEGASELSVVDAFLSVTIRERTCHKGTLLVNDARHVQKRNLASFLYSHSHEGPSATAASNYV